MGTGICSRGQMAKLFTSLIFVISVLLMGGCASAPPATQGDVNDLALEIQRLGPKVDPNEAERAARIAFEYPLQLAKEYQITDSPIVHNAKIYQGYRERGLCNHWTEDMNRRLKQEDFQTLTIHWAVSPPTEFRIIHHTVIISQIGDTLDEGIILDPWRFGGPLFWARTGDDTRYDWRPRSEVRAELLNARQLPPGQ